jgi:hypothetical protein
MSTPSITEFEITNVEKEIVARIFIAGDIHDDAANELKRSFLERGVFSVYGENITYDAIKDDKVLKRILSNEFVMCLPKTVETSRFGKVKVDGDSNTYFVASDYDLYFMDTRGLQQACTSFLSTVLAQAQKNRAALLRKINTKVKNTIEAWDFFGTPKKGQRAIPTPEEMKASTDELIRSRSSLVTLYSH